MYVAVTSPVISVEVVAEMVIVPPVENITIRSAPLHIHANCSQSRGGLTRRAEPNNDALEPPLRFCI
jgi:hypothetical protein